MLKLATILANPGEPPTETRYHDPQLLRSLGYNGLVIYETTALSGVAEPNRAADPEVRQWINQQIERVDRTIRLATEAGLAVYLFYDVFVLLRELVQENGEKLTCRNRSHDLCPASDETLERCVEGIDAMLRRWPQLAGIVLRFGDTDADRLPHLVGNDLYSPHCPRCAHLGRADRIIRLVKRVYQQVVRRYDKTLIVRTWNVRPNGIHDTPELARRVIEQLPDDERMILSFKFTQTDFWRYQQWNPSSLVAGRRPIIYELQCQREFEGKGALPNWQAPLWRDGCPETRQLGGTDGLAAASTCTNLAGVWAWVRGGGWGGPFVSDETWIDANVFAAPKLADNVYADDLAQRWVSERLDISDETTARAIIDTLEASPEIVRQAFYIGAYADDRPNGWHPNAGWISDDLLDAQLAWRMIQKIPETQLDSVVAEKQEAVTALAHCRASLHQALGDRHDVLLESLIGSLAYAESLCETLRDLVAGLVAYRRWQHRKSSIDAEEVRKRLLAAQSHWSQHTQPHGPLPGARVATPFREVHFWDLTEDLLTKVNGG